MPVGIADSSRQNRCYDTPLSNLGMDIMENSEILAILKEKHSISNSDRSNYSLSVKDMAPLTDDETMIKIVQLKLHQGRTTKSL